MAYGVHEKMGAARSPQLIDMRINPVVFETKIILDSLETTLKDYYAHKPELLPVSK
ncbi:hypothetical protein J4211_03850 [Candidatus Woesearchaeota archaeon]|nr:hypothetical protein [Candidatus Woesearchaeota archaeon]